VRSMVARVDADIDGYLLFGLRAGVSNIGERDDLALFTGAPAATIFRPACG